MADPHIDVAALNHANRHAAGQPDAVTPDAIGASPSGHTHAWGDITGKPSTFPSSGHMHWAEDVFRGGGLPVPPDALGDGTPTADKTLHGDGQWRTPTASRFLTGTGMPNGVVTAPVGTEYTDTAGTSGAYKWLKASGTGNTGWIVTFGDTGVRNISSLLINGWAPSNSDRWTMRRMNNTVMIGGYITGPSTTSDDVMTPIPAGFYGYDATGSWREFSSSSTKAGVVLVQRGSSGIITLRDAKGGTNIFTSVTFSTTDDWPTTLPGLPA